nr:MAG TPA: hypothetical protein [Caudoviricetes sp.]
MFIYVLCLLIVCCWIVNGYIGICCIYTFYILCIHFTHTRQTF